MIIITAACMDVKQDMVEALGSMASATTCETREHKNYREEVKLETCSFGT